MSTESASPENTALMVADYQAWLQCSGQAPAESNIPAEVIYALYPYETCSVAGTLDLLVHERGFLYEPADINDYESDSVRDLVFISETEPPLSYAEEVEVLHTLQAFTKLHGLILPTQRSPYKSPWLWSGILGFFDCLMALREQLDTPLTAAQRVSLGMFLYEANMSQLWDGRLKEPGFQRMVYSVALTGLNSKLDLIEAETSPLLTVEELNQIRLVRERINRE